MHTIGFRRRSSILRIRATGRGGDSGGGGGGGGGQCDYACFDIVSGDSGMPQ